MAPAGTAAAAYYQPAPQYAAQPQITYPGGYPVAPARGSLMSRLNWKHYLLALSGLLVLLAVPFIMFAVLKQSAPPTRPAPASVPPAASSNPAPAPETRTPVPNPGTPGQTTIAPGGEPARVPSGPGDARPSSDIIGGGEKKSNTAKKESDAAAREKARKAAEARRLLNQ